MTLHSVNLTGQEHLPPALCLLADARYKYSSQKHTIDADTNEHTYTIIVAAERLSPEATEKLMRGAIEGVQQVPGNLVSQIRSITTSEKSKKSNTEELKPVYVKVKIESSPTFVNASESEEEILSLESWNCEKSPPLRYSSLPDVTYCSSGFSPARAERMISMVHVEFQLIFMDVGGKRAKVIYTDEFPTDSIMSDVFHNFHRMCARKLRHQEFKPIVSYVVGKLDEKARKHRSRPLEHRDLRKTIGQLAISSKAEKITLIVNNID